MPRRLVQLFAGLVLYGVSSSMLLLAGLAEVTPPRTLPVQAVLTVFSRPASRVTQARPGSARLPSRLWARPRKPAAGSSGGTGNSASSAS